MACRPVWVAFLRKFAYVGAEATKLGSEDSSKDWAHCLRAPIVKKQISLTTGHKSKRPALVWTIILSLHANMKKIIYIIQFSIIRIM